MESMIKFGDVVIGLAAREVRVRNELRHPEPQACDVLWVLATRPERVIGNAELLDTVSSEQFVSESALTARMKDLEGSAAEMAALVGVSDNGPANRCTEGS